MLPHYLTHTKLFAVSVVSGLCHFLKAKEDEANVAKNQSPSKKSRKKFQTISCIVREMTDDEAFEAMITENLQRKDVDPIEEAFAFAQLAEKGRTLEDIALKIGKVYPVCF